MWRIKVMEQLKRRRMKWNSSGVSNSSKRSGRRWVYLTEKFSRRSRTSVSRHLCLLNLSLSRQPKPKTETNAMKYTDLMSWSTTTWGHGFSKWMFCLLYQAQVHSISMSSQCFYVIPCIWLASTSLIGERSKRKERLKRIRNRDSALTLGKTPLKISQSLHMVKW